MNQRVGLWLIGARGGVATMVSLGLASLQKGLVDYTGLVSELGDFEHLDLIDWSNIVVGGHEIRSTCLADEARNFITSSGAISPQLLESCMEPLQSTDKRIRRGILENAGHAIQQLADADVRDDESTTRAKIESVKRDVQEFADEHQLRTVVMINVASTEPPIATAAFPDTWSKLSAIIERPGSPLPSSTLYAVAAFELGYHYVNFTPSLGSNLPALHELADSQRVAHVGQDGKTGETLIKSALAPAFALRNLHVMSWVGHNIFGNRDGQILDDPENKKSKVATKDQLLEGILGYQPQSHISIEYIRSLGDWKTAWDHIHFRGFMGAAMTMQFTWQGCDSMLAAPLVLDLLRFTERAVRGGQFGVLDFLACFFKAPMGCCDNNFVRQFGLLQQWASHVPTPTAP